jgi:AraC family transcriptional regulator
MGVIGIGEFISWDGGCLLIGHSGGVVPLHAHYAIQVAFGVEPGIRFRARDGDPWTEYAAALVPSRQPHSMDATHVAPNAVLFVEPETTEGRALARRQASVGITAVPAEIIAEVGPPLFAAWREQRTAAALERAGRRVIGALAGGVPTMAPSDERLLRAMAYIRAHVHAPLTLAEVADVACLSPGRFRHLFVEQTGMALRPYILWRRFVHVWELLMQGASLSSAAHAAGFADAAHLTRTSRRMFGLPPSALQMASAPTGDVAAPATRGGESPVA